MPTSISCSFLSQGTVLGASSACWMADSVVLVGTVLRVFWSVGWKAGSIVLVGTVLKAFWYMRWVAGPIVSRDPRRLFLVGSIAASSFSSILFVATRLGKELSRIVKGWVGAMSLAD